ncbi:hypothetical protein GCM10011389_23210 [Pontibacillus salipaludis]|uniref:Uncharacterized protein n=1 Tax=Pontibacillus salipaludis TaxID=1697394 RepID=A0ABQ1Q7M3_9BACI|nr:hypothetical protein GCM10011389_23210 [Pontibacillus salipaludis]
MHKAVRVVFWGLWLGLLLTTLVLLYTGYYKVAGVLGVVFLFIFYNVSEFFTHKNTDYLYTKNRR